MLKNETVKHIRKVACCSGGESRETGSEGKTEGERGGEEEKGREGKGRGTDIWFPKLSHLWH